jgi:cell shape-determining protein MreC
VINNKKVFLVYIVFFFIFLTFLLFPKYKENTKLYSYFIKEKLEMPFKFVGLKINNLYSLFQSNKVHRKNIVQLEKENEYLLNINKYLLTITSKYNDLYIIFHEDYPTIPTTIGVSVIGDRNLLLNRDFIINKGKKSGIDIGNYVLDGVNVIGRVKSITNNNAEVVTVISKDYGDEVVINNQLFIVTGTNNNYLSFLRQKNTIEEIIFKKNQKVMIKNEFIDLTLGRIDFIDKQPVVITLKNLNLDNLRVLING